MKRRKKIMKIIISIILILVVILIAFLGIKLYQLNSLKNKSATELISMVTKTENTYISMAVIEDGQITYHTYVNGGQEIDNLTNQYEIGSISKTLLAFLTAKAIEEGRLDLHASIAEYLDLPEGKYYPTVDRLLTHMSGYKNYYFESEMTSNHLNGRNEFSGISKDKLLARVASTKLEDKDYPWVYSNFGISVMGLVLEQVYGQDYTTLLTEYLHDELHMNATSVATSKGNLSGYWDWNSQDAYIPAGSVISNITDMATYLQFCMNCPESYSNMPFEDIKEQKKDNLLYSIMGFRVDAMGMTWIHDKHAKIIWHNGSTSHFNSYIGISEDHTKGVVMLANYGADENLPVTVIGPKIMQELLTR